MPRKCRGSAKKVPRKFQGSAKEVPRKYQGSAEGCQGGGGWKIHASNPEHLPVLKVPSGDDPEQNAGTIHEEEKNAWGGDIVGDGHGDY